MPTELLCETSAVLDEAAVRETGTAEVLLITPGLGTSGTYPAATLQQAAHDRVFPAGLHMFLDHPGATEESDRPERSVRDLAGTLTSDAEWRESPEPGLYATARVYPQWRGVLAEMADDIGLSIRGYGEQDSSGTVTRLTQALSVDFVTRAGRGGRILALVESARRGLAEARNAGEWLESRIHLRFTEMADQLFGDGHLTRDERIVLSAGIGQALTAFTTHVQAEAPHLYDRDPYDLPAQTRPTQENAMPEISQEEYDRLREAATERDTLRTENQQLTAQVGSLQEARDDLLARDLARTARDHATTALASEDAPDLSERARTRVADRVVSGELPTTESGALDETVLTARIMEAAREEAAYLAEAMGAPPVAGGGAGNDPTTRTGTPTPTDAVMSESDRERAYASAFGLSEGAAKAAATI